MLFRKFINVAFVMFLVNVNADVNPADKIVAEIGHKTGQSRKITYNDVLQYLMSVLQMRGIAPQQFLQLVQKDPEVFARLFNDTKDAMIKDSALGFMAKNKNYKSNAAYTEMFDKAAREVEIRIFKKEYAEKATVTDADMKAEYDKMIGEMKTIKQYSGRMIVVKSKSVADGIIKAVNNREKSKPVDEAFIAFGKSHSITPFEDNKGAFSMNENELLSSYGKAVFDIVKSTKTGTLSVVKFDEKSKFNNQYGVFLISKVEDAKKPDMESIKAVLKARIIEKNINKLIEESMKDIGLKMYNKDGLLEENKSKL